MKKLVVIFFIFVALVGIFSMNVFAEIGKPVLLSPSGTIETTTPTLMWQSVTGATKYGLYISKYPYGAQNLVYENENIPQNYTYLNIPSGILEEGMSYNWNMRAGNGSSWGGFVTSNSFTILKTSNNTIINEIVPDKPVLTSPLGTIDTIVPKFMWQSVNGATKYGLYISEYPYGEQNLVYENENISGNDTYLDIPSGILKEGIDYKWNMRAGNGSGWGAFVTSNSFEISKIKSDVVIDKIIPDKPILFSPSGKINLNSLKFVWQSVNGATKYGLYISKYPYGEQNLVYKNEDISTNYTYLEIQPGILKEGINYKWNMRAANNNNWGELATSIDFYTNKTIDENVIVNHGNSENNNSNSSDNNNQNINPNQDKSSYYEKPVDVYPNRGGYLGFLSINSDPVYKSVPHLGCDFKSEIGTNVYSVLDGVVVLSGEYGYFGGSNGESGGAIVIKHNDGNGNPFYALYGHVNRLVQVDEKIKKGQLIGTIRKYDNMPHLHFGINIKEPSTLGYGDQTNWRNPVTFLENLSKNIKMTLAIGNPNLELNSEKQEIDYGRQTSPVIVNGITLCPIRGIIEGLGGVVEWNNSEKKVSINLNSKKVELWLNEKYMSLDGIKEGLDVTPQIIGSRMMVPVRKLIEYLGYSVKWDSVSKKINIESIK